MTLLTVQTKAKLQRAIWMQQGKIRRVKRRDGLLDATRENKEDKEAGWTVGGKLMAEST